MREIISYWGLLILGFVVLGIQIYRYATNQLSDFMTETPVFLIGVLFLFSPKTIIQIVKNKYGK